jgi:hypothetical protein
MKTEDLNKLLEKYYDGDTSDAEEQALREFFCGNNIPAGYEAEKEIFGFYATLEQIPEPSADFEKRILAAVDKTVSGSSLMKKRRLVYSLVSAAAGLLILTGSYFFFMHRSEPADTFSDPELAYAETIKILHKVSSKLNHGTRSLNSLGKMQAFNSMGLGAFDRSAIIFEEKMKSLEYIGKAMDLFTLPPADSINK